MFGLFKKKDTHKQNSFVYDQALILRVPQSNEMGDAEIMNRVTDLESDLGSLLPAKSGVDGHEIGNNEALLYIYGPSADELYIHCRSTIAEYFSGQGAEITLQYGLPDNRETKEKKISI